jgi:6-phosphogluconolactonase
MREPGEVEIRVFEGGGQLVRATAEEVALAADQSLAARGRFTWALSGGSTPRALYRLLASDFYRERLPWRDLHVFWGDERHVPPNHPESNFGMAREAMLDKVPLPAANVHRIRGEEPDARRAAAEYELELRACFNLADGEWPRFDLVLLGLGAEGHTASLFPGSRALRERERRVVAPWVESLRAFRITLTLPVLNHARRVLFLVSGEEKAAAVHAVLEGARDPERYPAQLVEGNRLWLLDGAAARLLQAAG